MFSGSVGIDSIAFQTLAVDSALHLLQNFERSFVLGIMKATKMIHEPLACTSTENVEMEKNVL